MKKVICTAIVMLALSTSASAAGNVKTFNDIGRDMLLVQAQTTTVRTDTAKYTDYDNYWHVFGVEVLHTWNRFYKS